MCSTVRSMLRNGSFEGDYVAVAPGWTADVQGVWRYGVPRVLYTRDGEKPHSGRACQRIRFLVKKGLGEARLASDPVALRAGERYGFSVWLRGAGVPRHAVAIGLQAGEVVTRYKERLPGILIEQGVEVGGDWQRFQVIGIAAADAEARAYVRLGALGTLWVDDATLETIGKEEAAPATVVHAAAVPEELKGNLVPNSSFEAGTTGWGPYPLLACGAGQVTAAPSPHGSYAFRLHNDSADPGAPRRLESWYFRIPRSPLTVSLHLRAQTPGELVRVRLISGMTIGNAEHDRPEAVGTFRLNTDWKRFSFKAPPLASNLGTAILAIEPSPGGTIWIDAVQIQAGELTPYRPRSPVEVGAELLNRLSILLPGEKAQVRIRTAGACPQIKAKLCDYYDCVRESWTLEMTAQACGGCTILEIVPPATGVFRLIAEAPGASAPAEVSFASVPEPHRPDGKLPFAATHARVGPFSMAVAKRLGFQGWRTHDFGPTFDWCKIQPAQDRWDWEATDRDLAVVLEQGFHVVATFFRPPTWAPDSGDVRYPGVAGAAGDTRALEAFVRRAVQRYKDRIRCWEVWNEPSESRPLDPGDYVRILESVYRTVKEEDPAATVIGGGGVNLNRLDWLREICRLGALDYMDVLSYHGYGWDPTTTTDDRMGFAADQLDQGLAVQEIIAEFGKSLPLWNTESGSMCPEIYRHGVVGNEFHELGLESPWWDAVNQVSKLILGMKAHGFPYWGQYYLGYADGGESSCLHTNAHANLVDYRGAARPSAVAIAAALGLLHNVEPLGETRPADSVRLYAFAHPKGALVAVGTYFMRGMQARIEMPGAPAANAFNVTGESRRIEPKHGVLAMDISDEVIYVLFEETNRDDAKSILANATVRNAPPRAVCDVFYLTGARLPDALLGMTYQDHSTIGAVDVYAFASSDAQAWVLLAHSEHIACPVRFLGIEGTGVTIADPLGNVVPVADGRCLVADGVPYILRGTNAPALIKDLGARPPESARETSRMFGF